ncbi:hypothetical protein M5D96_009483, partial [Drosophila gunungcola]
MFVQLLTKNKLRRQQLFDIKRNNRNLRCNANTLNLPDRQFFQSYRIDKRYIYFPYWKNWTRLRPTLDCPCYP